MKIGIVSLGLGPFSAPDIMAHLAKSTDEALQAPRVLWRKDPSTVKGVHFDFQRIRSFPKPGQKGGVPILVGGHSDAAARRAARYGDGFYPLTPIVDADVSKIDFVK